MEGKTSIIGKIIAVIVVIGIIVGLGFLCWNCESCQRVLKSIDSDMNGGLNRIVTVYSYTGDVIATHKGKLDIEYNESNNKVLFDLDGKRYIYYNAVVEVIEVSGDE